MGRTQVLKNGEENYECCQVFGPNREKVRKVRKTAYWIL
jgi:hypothetical protein